MDHFAYRDGQLHCEEVPVATIVEAVGTPVYVYSTATFTDHYEAVARAFAKLGPLICYSIKSCANVHICRLLRRLGAGFDVVSGGELVRALEAGVDPAKIVFAGVGKSDAEIHQAMDAKIGWFNVESQEELENLIAIAQRRGESVKAALRVNPDVDPKTHRYTTTGKKETKFGVDLEKAKRIFARLRQGAPGFGSHPRTVAPASRRCLLTGQRPVCVRRTGRPVPQEASEQVPGSGTAPEHQQLPSHQAPGFPAQAGAVRLCGIHLHIGSPVNRVEPYVEAIEKGLALVEDLRRDGVYIDTIDIGGGFGAHYRADEAPPAVRYAEAIVPLLEGRGLRTILEPGRSIAANAGILVAKTLYRKASGDRDFLILDAGMNDFIRPALYDAYHFIWPVRPPVGFVPSRRGEDVSFPGMVPMDVVGPVCEAGDFFARQRLLPPLKRGDLVAIFSAGAYGMVMASHYNTRPNPPEVLVEGGGFRVIRRRETCEDLLAAERESADRL